MNVLKTLTTVTIQMAFAQTLQDHLLVRVTLDTKLMLMVLHVQVIHEDEFFFKIIVEQ
jgi:hypothetical protein